MTVAEFHSPSRLSFSSLSTYAECGEKWRLTRGLKIEPEHTWWATLGGSVVHELIEVHLKLALGEDVKLPQFEEVFARHEQEARDAGLQIWASGRELKNLSFAGGPGKRGRDWWLSYGPRMLPAFLRWLEDRISFGWEVMSTEQEFQIEIGGELVLGSIDIIMLDDAGEIRIIDAKTGNETPGKLQLGTYRDGLRNLTHLDASWGHYLRWDVETAKVEVPQFNAGEPVLWSRGEKKGQQKTTTVTQEGDMYAYLAGNVDYTVYTSEYIESQYRAARRGIEAGIFLANTRNACNYCPVKDYCRGVAGRKSLTYPVESVILPRKAVEETVSPLVD
jgi:hypothetical protein